MTLNELIERLEDLRDEIGGDSPVRGVQQPTYPLLAQIEAITAIYEGDKVEAFIALAEPKAYGTRDHYADDVICLDEFCDQCGCYECDCEVES